MVEKSLGIFCPLPCKGYNFSPNDLSDIFCIYTKVSLMSYLGPETRQGSNSPYGLPSPPLGECEHVEVELLDELYLDGDLLLSGGLVGGMEAAWVVGLLKHVDRLEIRVGLGKCSPSLHDYNVICNGGKSRVKQKCKPNLSPLSIFYIG